MLVYQRNHCHMHTCQNTGKDIKFSAHNAFLKQNSSCIHNLVLVNLLKYFNFQEAQKEMQKFKTSKALV
jgi:hypothetical protein